LGILLGRVHTGIDHRHRRCGLFTAAPASPTLTAWIDDDDNVAMMQHFVDTVGLITRQVSSGADHGVHRLD
jgi:hypothetical protein